MYGQHSSKNNRNLKLTYLMREFNWYLEEKKKT